MFKKMMVKGFMVVALVASVAGVIPVSAFAAIDAMLAAPSVVQGASLTANAPVPVSNADFSAAVNAVDFGYGPKGKTVAGVKGMATAAAVAPAVAVITVFSDSSYSSAGDSSAGALGALMGQHAFITIQNVSSSNIDVGKLSGLAPGKSLSLGTWRNVVTTEHNGLWYDLEAYLIARRGYYSNRVSASYIMTSAQLNTLNSYIINNDYWSFGTNCSSFASGAWNSAVDASYRLSAGAPNTPKGLANSIRSVFSNTYRTGYVVPNYYPVYYAKGTGTPAASQVYR
jgi:hypothetical protein